MRLRTSLGLLALLGCASAPVPWAPVARPNPQSCSATGAPSTEQWRLVAAEGFTFCVPADWQATDGRTWRGATGYVTWKSGRYPTAASSSDAVVPRAGEQSPSGCSASERREEVAGHIARLQEMQCRDGYHTGAIWEDEAVYFWGRAAGAQASLLQWQIYRTVRFVPDRGH